MTAFTDRFAARAAPMLQAEHGEDVTHYPLGAVQDAAPLAGVMVSLSKEDMRDQSTGLETVRDDKGKRIVRTGILTVPASVSVDDRDTWLVRTEVWHTVRVKGRDPIFQQVEIRKSIPIETRRPRIR